MTGAVLAGGKSVRFGRNKALEVLDGKRFIERAMESLSPFCDQVMVIANELEPYVDLGVELVQDVVPNQGPLGGIYTALLFSRSDWVLVMATDMPFIVPAMASLLIDSREGFDAVVPKTGKFFEPLLALYNRRCLPAIARQLESEERQIIRFYKKIKVRSIEETEWRTIDPRGMSFKNVNTPEDLGEIQWT